MAAYAALTSLAQTTHLYTTQDKYFLSIGVEGKVRSIHEYVIILLSFFHDFPDKSKRWEGKMRDVAHETEDTIEQFMWQQSYHKRKKLSSVKFEDQLRILAEKLCLIAGDLMDERPDYSPLAISSSSSAAASPSSSRFAPASKAAVVGLDEDVMLIKDWLCGLSSKLQVVPIVGMGGIGKTTLAQTVYDDPVILWHFHIRVWLTISQDYSARKLLLGLLHSMNLIDKLETSIHEIEDSTMAERVYKNLKGRRYLIVMDDVWSTKVWDDVRNIFPDDGNGSRIMLTTRLADLATYPISNSPIHEMRFMNNSQSWDLLKRKVFANSNCPPGLEGIGEEIAQRCAGLPLVVVIVAGILVNKTRAFWGEFAKNVIPVVAEEIEEILSLSYTHLPHHLRPCFLLIGSFLEDANIRTSRLIRLWIAEGFVKHQNGRSKSLEDEAEEYLEELVRRNLVIVTSRKSNGKIKSCSLHDMVRGLCLRKAREERFLQVIDGCDRPQGLLNERRISFSRSDIDKIWSPTIHTVLCFQTHSFPSWIALIRSYKLLRVLDVLGVEVKEIHSEIFELYHLRYLALMGSISIPSAISNLVNLQTLIIHLFGKLRGRYNDGVLHFLPLEIWRMPQLRHLFFNAPYILPHPLEGLNLLLENLQTLFLVKDLVWNEKLLEMIPNIKKLGLTYTTNEEYHLHHLKDLHHLEKLEVIGYGGFSWRRQNHRFPCTLKKLTFVGGGNHWKDMAAVGSLPNLQVLKLLDHACDGETWETFDGDFPRLKFLVIGKSHLRQWIYHRNSLPTLERLVLRSCWYLKEIPESIGEITTLEVIEVDCCTKSLVESAMKIKEDQESYGNYGLQVRASSEVIPSCYKRMDLSQSRPTTSCDDVLMVIKDRLRGQPSELQVISVVGSNRTTFARTVYYHPLIVEHFEIRVWFTVPTDYNPRTIVVELGHSMKLLECGGKIDESEMATKIYEKLRGRLYLFVIDGVWSRDIWDGLKKVFPGNGNGNGSRIMLTTPELLVASYANSGSVVREMWLVGQS